MLPTLPTQPALQAIPESGRFRGAPEDCQISAQSDLEAVHVWLKECARRSVSTYQNYRKEAERLLLWAAVRGQALSDLSRDDLAGYDTFLKDPEPRDIWVGPRKARANEEWKPFVGPLAAASREQTFNVLRSLYSYLHGVGYLRTNPLSRSKLGRDEKMDDATRIRHRYLPESVWEHVQAVLGRMPMDTPRARMHAARSQWVFTLIYETGARRGEIAIGKMGDFFRDADGRRWLQITGKGNKPRDVPVSQSLFERMLTYREICGLPLTSLPGDETPLVLNITGRKGISGKILLRIVKEICGQAADELEATEPDRAISLRSATAHWLRHSRATHSVRAGADLRHVQRLLGHAKIETTMLYQHIEQEEFHEGIVGREGESS